MSAPVVENEPGAAVLPPSKSTAMEPGAALHQPPPNGGLLAWLQVLGSFFCFMNTWGLINTFGAFQTYYSANLLAHEPESTIAWIGSIQAFLLLASTLVMGPLCDLGYTRPQFIICSVMAVFGLMMTSLCTQYWQFMLAQGICMGIGFGGVFIPAVSIPSSYFTTKRAFALGVCASGSSFDWIPMDNENYGIHHARHDTRQCLVYEGSRAAKPEEELSRSLRFHQVS
ncbi:hypothetical protein BP5796_05638 [Coleophoma crateriformis]|uniref:Major facilitator superfamily (MFS) profile domain-containing protein n=1 Tax=Coleophoma crateriformis TaxID=565419 RepID=A0A3D8S439_9HELO|nr:hypothetical protein BP5796_05638 [Coleophoma crateriformis]